MSKKFRIIPSVQFKNGSVVKSINYQNHRIVGDLASTMRVYSRRQADELIFYNIDAMGDDTINWNAISTCVQNSNMPLTYGGGVRTENFANLLIANGFDKISFNTILFEEPKVIYRVAKLIGSSSTVASIDLRIVDSKLHLFSHGGTRCIEEFEPSKTVEFLESLGVGEVVINCIDHDGLMNGYNFDIVSEVPNIAKIPILLSGGCSGSGCILKAFEYGFDGAVMSSLFLWKGDSIPSLKNELYDCVPVRRVMA